MEDPFNFDELETQYKDGQFTAPVANTKNRPTFPCEHCNGTGKYQGIRVHQEKDQCFACKGRGHFFTTEQERKALRNKNKDSKAQKFADAQAAFNERCPGLREFLHGASSWSPFAQSLYQSLSQYGALTEKQETAALSMKAKCDERDRARNAERFAKQQAEANAPPVFAALAAAFLSSGAHLQHPKLRLVTEDGQKVVLSRCGEGSRTPGEINVTDGGPFGANRYFGRISPDGRVFWRDPVVPGVVQLLTTFNADPKEAIKLQGIRTGNCCCCGRQLTDPISVANGIGPVCAEQWGF